MIRQLTITYGSYFPAAALEAAGEESLDQHRLRPQIIACQLTNDLVDLMGATFVNRVSRDTGRTPSEVAGAWLIAARLADHDALVRRVSRAGNGLSSRVVYRWLLGLARVLERTTRWLLLNVEVDHGTAPIIARHRDGLGKLRADFAEFVAGDDRIVFERRITEIERHGAEPDLAKNLITLRFLDQLLEILRVAQEAGAKPLVAGRGLLPNIRALPCSMAAAGGLRICGRGTGGSNRPRRPWPEDLSRAHYSLTRRVLESSGETEGIDTNTSEFARFRDLMEEIREEDTVSISALAVAVRKITGMAAGGDGT